MEVYCSDFASPCEDIFVKTQGLFLIYCLGARVEGAAHGAPPGPPDLGGPALLQDGQEVPRAGVRHHSTVRITSNHRKSFLFSPPILTVKI
jgi:hypothetical protein